MTTERKALQASNTRAQYAITQVLERADEDLELREFFDAICVFLQSSYVEDLGELGPHLSCDLSFDQCLAHLVDTCRSNSNSTNACFILSPQQQREWILVIFAAITEGIYIVPRWLLADAESENFWLKSIFHNFAVDTLVLIGSRGMWNKALSNLYNTMRFIRGVIAFASLDRPDNPVYNYSSVYLCLHDLLPDPSPRWPPERPTLDCVHILEKFPVMYETRERCTRDPYARFWAASGGRSTVCHITDAALARPWSYFTQAAASLHLVPDRRPAARAPSRSWLVCPQHNSVTPSCNARDNRRNASVLLAAEMSQTRSAEDTAIWV
ncbi:hypothetical protein K488DRAFT_71909 [Vararia minispora EC-137]|uniref:Uncharacterized protein n=1 Tax=Vararia minispora EC-137 TaxID=1314806 RepID=A0ACB8QGP7_9AGAM|nr:hypothetical protein K488DRAFT_71909 [Vararia minispora EC-137]